jgi:hypothetical protein
MMSNIIEKLGYTTSPTPRTICFPSDFAARRFVAESLSRPL